MVGYISGIVVKSVASSLDCQICIEALQTSGSPALESASDRQIFALVERKKERGNLNIVAASLDTVQVCLDTEKIVRACLIENGRPPNMSNLSSKLENDSFNFILSNSP